MNSISIYLSNRGKYTEGQLIGEWVTLPIEDDELTEVLKRIGINEVYEEWFISDYEVEINGLGNAIREESDLNKLNEIATMIDNLGNYEEKLLEAIFEIESCSDVNEVIEIIDNLEDYALLTEVFNDTDLGYYYADEYCYIESIPKHLRSYFDYEKFGRDIRLDSVSDFTKWGFVIRHN